MIEPIPASSEEPAVLAARLRMAMMRLVRRIKRETAGPTTPSAISALAAIRRLESPTVGELAAAEGISRPSASEQADGLEERGLLRRERSEVDGRRVHLRLTPAGQRALERSASQRTAWLARRLRRLSAEDLAALRAAADILERLVEVEG